jgi:general secretion pathway protein G
MVTRLPATVRPCVALRHWRGGFTLIELLVVLSIVALLLTLAAPRYFGSIDQTKETVLIENLRATRSVIDQFYADTGHYPASLVVLVERKYLRSVPVDPYTESSQTWIEVIAEDETGGGIRDMKSGADGQTRDGRKLGDL